MGPAGLCRGRSHFRALCQVPGWCRKVCVCPAGLCSSQTGPTQPARPASPDRAGDFAEERETRGHQLSPPGGARYLPGENFLQEPGFPSLQQGQATPPPAPRPAGGMAVGPSPSGAASVTCGPQRSIQGPHLRMEGIQEAAWEKEREDAFVGPGSSERPELRAAARGRGWRVGGTARGRDGAWAGWRVSGLRPGETAASAPSRRARSTFPWWVLKEAGVAGGREGGWRGPAHAGSSSARVCRALRSPRRVMRRGARGHSSRGRSGQSKAGRAQGSGGPWDRGSPARYSQDW